jgi:hypothetical protein
MKFSELKVGDAFRLSDGKHCRKSGLRSYVELSNGRKWTIGTTAEVVEWAPIGGTFQSLSVGDVFTFADAGRAPQRKVWRKSGPHGAIPDDNANCADLVIVQGCELANPFCDWPTWAPRATIVLTLDAGTDRNGNPRRGFLFLDSRGDVCGFEDCGYAGLPEWARRAVRSKRMGEGPRIGTSPSELREWLRIGKYGQGQKGALRHCPKCKGNTYTGSIGVDANRCDRCDGKGLVQ